MKTVSGELHLSLTFNRPVKLGEDDYAYMEEGMQENESQIDSLMKASAEELEPFPPNEVAINIIQARNLEAMNSTRFGQKESSDPYVRIRIDGCPDQSTGYIKGNLAPVWNEKLIFSGVKKDSTTIQVTVYDYNNFQMKKLMGRVFVPLYEFYDKKPKKDGINY